MTKKTSFIVGAVVVIVAVVLIAVFSGHAPEGSVSSATSAGAVPSATSTPGLYTDPNGAFSFSYPLTATVQNTTDADGSGTTLLVNAPAVATVGTTSAASAGASAEQVQVSISSFDENISLTAARIKKDIVTIQSGQLMGLRVVAEWDPAIQKALTYMPEAQALEDSAHKVLAEKAQARSGAPAQP